MSEMKIYYARHSGFCFGVKRAIKMAIDATRGRKVVYSLGPLIHNPIVVDNLSKKGIITVSNINEIKGRHVIIRSHGIHPAIGERLKKNFAIIDATCPKVRRAQLYAQKLAKEGYKVIIVGEKDHPEVKGLLGYAGQNGEIYTEGFKMKNRRIGIVPQTTLNIEYLTQAVSKMLPYVLEMKIYNTICNETILRINETLEIAKKVDVMIIVGGKNSANTTRLYQMCKRIRPSYHIETADEILPDWFNNNRSIGITAGASTPKEQVRKIVRCLKRGF